jgi:antirestriction protein ArdC
MSRSAARARSGQDRTSLYREITDKIIAELEAGRAPWVQPWGTAAAKAALAMPRNASTHRRYSGINVLILWGAVIERGFSSQSWLTFRQALGLGGNVRKGVIAESSQNPTLRRCWRFAGILAMELRRYQGIEK